MSSIDARRIESSTCDPNERPRRHGCVQSHGHSRRTRHFHADLRRLGLDHRPERCRCRLRLSGEAPCRPPGGEGGALWFDHQPGPHKNPGSAPARGLQLEPDQHGVAGQGRSGHRPRSQRRLHGISVVVRNRDVLTASAHRDRRFRTGQADVALAAEPVEQGERQRPDRARDHARRRGIESRKYAGDRAVRPDGRQGIRMDGRSGFCERDVSRHEERYRLAAGRDGSGQGPVPGRLRDHGGLRLERRADRCRGLHAAGSGGCGAHRRSVERHGCERPIPKAGRRLEEKGSISDSGSNRTVRTRISTAADHRRSVRPKERSSRSVSRARTS